MSISSNSNSYILHKYHRQLHNHIIFQLLASRLPVLTFYPTTIFLSHLVWAISVEPRQVRVLIVDNVPSDVLPSQVPKVNVTTGRTANASHRQQKQDANFACTVPGCGFTLTRGFNLKGHLRSHSEEKPYKCHWPGCGKGFARQHDCKRLEQLHGNFRPFECEGCRKQFARMDALNRHLKSETECAIVVEREGEWWRSVGGIG